MALKKDCDCEYKKTDDCVFLDAFTDKAHTLLLDYCKRNGDYRLKRHTFYQFASWRFMIDKRSSKLLIRLMAERGFIVNDKRGLKVKNNDKHS